MNLIENKTASLFIAIIFFLTSSSFLQAQTTIFGQVTHQLNKETIISAQVFAYKTSNGELITSTITDYEGNYSMKIDEVDEIRVEVSALFFQSTSKTVQIRSNQEVNFTLLEKTLNLNEVSIVAKRPVKKNQDTTVYNAEYFSRGDEVVAEDLLRSIPGVSVSQDGRITIKGREVEKVMIDSDDFFEKGYRTLTKSLKASLIEEVEVLDKYSNLSGLKGFEQSEKVAINLKLDESARARIFGDISAGVDINSLKRYTAQSNVINLRGKQKFYGVFGAGNIGDRPFEAIDNLWKTPSITNNSLIDYNLSSAPVTYLSIQQPGFRSNRTVDNRMNVASLSGIIHAGEKVKIRPIFSGFLEDQFSSNNQRQIFQLNNSSREITNERASNLNNQLRQVMGRIEVLTEETKYGQLTSRTSFRLGNKESVAGTVINGQPSVDKLDAVEKYVSQRITYLKKISSNSALFLTAFGGIDERPEMYNSNRNIFHPFLSETGNMGSIEQVARTEKRHLQVESHLFLNRRNESSTGLEFIAGLHIEEDFLSYDLSANSSILSGTEDDSPIGSRIGITNKTSYLKAVYSGQKNKFKYRLGLAGNFFTNSGAGALESIQSEKRILLNPEASAKYQVSKKDYFEVNAAHGFRTVSMTDLMPSVYLQSNTLLRSGIDNLSPLIYSRIGLSHFHGHFSDKFSIVTTAAYQYDNNYLSAETAFFSNFTHQRTILNSGRKTFQFSSSASQFLPGLRNSIRFSVGAGHRLYSDKIEGVPGDREIATTNTSAGCEIRSTFRGSVNYHAGISINRSAFGKGVSSSYQERRFFTDLNLKAGKKIRFVLSSESFRFSSINTSKNQLWLMDIKGDYEIVPKKITLSLSINNLLDERVFQTIENTPVFYSQSSYELLPRFLIISGKIVI